MKKLVFLPLVTLVLLFSACTEITSIYDNPVQEEITVTPFTGIATKAPIDGTVFPTTNSIFLAAYYNDPISDVHSKNYFPETEFVYDAALSTQNGKPTWKTNATRYWPFTGTLDMLAYSTTMAKTTHYAATWNTTNFTDQVRIAMAADEKNAEGKVTNYAGDDLVVGRTPAATKTNQGMIFQHTKAWIAWTVTSSEQAQVDLPNKINKGITIRKICLNKAKYSGTVTVAKDNNAPAVPTIAWSDLASQVDTMVVPNFTATLLDGVVDPNTKLQTPIAIGDGLLIPDQNYVSGTTEISFTIHYTIHNGMDEAGTGANDIEMIYVYEPAKTAAVDWVHGNKYIYAIQMTLDAITVQPTVALWAPTSGDPAVTVGTVTPVVIP